MNKEIILNLRLSGLYIFQNHFTKKQNSIIHLKYQRKISCSNFKLERINHKFQNLSALLLPSRFEKFSQELKKATF